MCSNQGLNSQYLEKFELLVENLPWIDSREEEERLEVALNHELPRQSFVKIIEKKEALNGEDVAYVRCNSEIAYKELLSRQYTKCIFFEGKKIVIKKSDRINTNTLKNPNFDENSDGASALPSINNSFRKDLEEIEANFKPKLKEVKANFESLSLNMKRKFASFTVNNFYFLCS